MPGVVSAARLPWISVATSLVPNNLHTGERRIASVGERKKTNSALLHGAVRSHLDHIDIGAATVIVAVIATTT